MKSMSAAAIAALRLPGLPASERNVRARAEREAWRAITVPSRGRNGERVEYLVDELPPAVRNAVRGRLIEAALPAVVSAPLPPQIIQAASDLTDRQRLERDARAGVLAAISRLQSETACTLEAAITTLLTTARAGRLDASLDRMLKLARDPRGRAGDGYPSSRTLKRWISATDLAPSVPRPTMQVPAWAKCFLRHYQRPQKPSVQDAYRDACRDWAGEPFSVHQARRFLGQLGSVTRERGRMGPRELKNIQPFIRRSFDQLLPNDVWTADGHTFDAEVQHPLHGRPFRPEITTIVDVATRRAVGWSVGLAESAAGVADALRYAVERNGILALFYVDNGSGFRNVEIGDEALGLLGRIGATPTYSLPYNSQARGVIERFHQTVWVAGAKSLPAYIGAAMDREARLEQFKLTRRALKHGGAMPLMPWALFVQWAQERIDEYNARAHRSLGGTSPDLAWAAHAARGWQAETVEAAELATLFRPRVVRTLARAEITLFTNTYFARELEEFHGLEAHIAYDIHDASKVWVYTPEGRLICEAKVNGNTRHYIPVPVVEQARQKRAKGRLARVETKRDEILAELHGAPALAAPAAQQIVIGGRVIDPAAALARRREQAETIEAAPTTPAPPAHLPSIQPAAPSRGQRDPAANYAEWLALDARIANAEEVSDADARWHRTYPHSAQYKAQAKKTATGAATRVA